MSNDKLRLVIFGASNIISDLFDCALANDLIPSKVVLHLPEDSGEGAFPWRCVWRARGHVRAARYRTPLRIPAGTRRGLSPRPDDADARPAGRRTASTVRSAFTRSCIRLPMFRGWQRRPRHVRRREQRCAAGAVIDEHVFINRLDHWSRHARWVVQSNSTGSNVGGLSRIGRGVTVGIGATLIERLVVGDNAVIGAGGTVLHDVAENVVVVGTPRAS